MKSCHFVLTARKRQTLKRTEENCECKLTSDIRSVLLSSTLKFGAATAPFVELSSKASISRAMSPSPKELMVRAQLSVSMSAEEVQVPAGLQQAKYTTRQALVFK